MNDSLIGPHTVDEIVHAVKQMDPIKAPGLDGLPPIFFQQYWSVIGDDVVRQILEGGDISSGVNHTHICLIPKVKSPQFINQYCPISLCNILIKIVIKVIANRLKRINGYCG